MDQRFEGHALPGTQRRNHQSEAKYDHLLDALAAGAVDCKFYVVS